MDNENEVLDDTVDEPLDLPEIPEGEEDTTDWKAKAQEIGIKSRERTKSLKAKLAEKDAAIAALAGSKAPTQTKTGDLDETSLLWLEVKGVKTEDADEMKLVEDWRKDSGKDVRAIFSSRVFQAELKALRDDAAVRGATPSSTKRAGGQVGDVASAAAKFRETGVLPEDRALADAVVDSIAKPGNDRLPPWQR